MPYALLIGNGINRAVKSKNDSSWKSLLENIKKDFLPHITIDIRADKSFPLLYEEIFLRLDGSVKELEIKNRIAQWASALVPNKFHEEVRKLPITDILTTNYDLLLEGTAKVKNAGIINEKKYSIFRHFVVDGKRFWHVHGDQNYPESINLGFEHYGGQLQQLRNYIATGTQHTSPKVPQESLIRRLDAGLTENNSWVDLFFTTDIYIVGLTLDFIETDLWWLLTFRARQKITNPSRVTNRIVMFVKERKRIPKKMENSYKDQRALFDATGVEVVEIKASGFKSFYDKVINELKTK